MNSLQPTYTTANCKPAYQLNWSVTIFWNQPVETEDWLDKLRAATEKDGVRILQHRFSTSSDSQFLTSTKPDLAPPEMVRSIKGRLQYLMRNQFPKAFRGNYSVRRVGSQKRETIEEYVASQLDHHPMSNQVVGRRLAKFQIACPEIDLSQPRRSSHGQFWYNLHVVLVKQQRWMEIGEDMLTRTHAGILAVAKKKGHLLSRAAILPDHVHLTLGCNWTESPSRVALAYMNNLAYACGKKDIFQ